MQRPTPIFSPECKPPLWCAFLLAACFLVTSAPSADAQTFIRADSNSDSVINVADVIATLSMLFLGGFPPNDAADVNDNGEIEISDAAYLLRHLFAGGNAPPAPYPTPGTDTTPPNFPSVPTGELTYSLGSTTGCIGIPTSIPFRVTNTVPMEALHIHLQFDPAELSFLQADDTAIISAYGGLPDFFQVNPLTGGVQVGILFNLVSPTLAGLAPQNSTTLLDFEFDLDPGLPAGANVQVTLADDLTLVPASRNLGSAQGQVVLADIASNATIVASCFPADADYSLDTPQNAVPGNTVTSTVLLTNQNPVAEFSFGLAFDTNQLTYLSASATGVLAATNGNAGPDFLAIDAAPMNGAGITVACTISTGAPADTIPAGTGASILDLTFDVAANAGPPCSFIDLSFVGTLGMPPVPIETVDDGGMVFTASSINGAIEVASIAYPPPSGGVNLSAPSVSAIPGNNVIVPVHLDTDIAIEAVSFGLAFDPLDLTAVSVAPGTALDELSCGAGPDFFTSGIFADGITIASVFDISPPFDGASLGVGAEQEIVLVTLSTSANPTSSVSPLDFSDQLGGGTLPVTIEVSTNGNAVIPTTTSGAVTFSIGGTTFSRGDCNDDGSKNIADAITVLGYLFPTGGSPVVLSCDDACDGNDDGNLDVADGVAILNSLFGNPAIPLPPPAICGGDATADSLDCASTASCP